ncbi:MAG TPA: putative cytokinetic ring protein SteA [Actinomycetota bacterium]|nr:putative cytokinetic ring protein SteA [Actinomycetota bacterium]
MKAARLRAAAHQSDLVVGRARVDRRTKRLLDRIEPGEIAIVDHEDIDRVAAEGLVQRQVAAVINASRSTSGRYPNLGPLLLCSAGIPLIDETGPEVMRIAEGERIAIESGRVFRGDGSSREEVARGRVLDLEHVEQVMDAAKKSLSTELERFAENTIEFIRAERDVLLEAARLPDVDIDWHGRHVLVVVRGYDYKDDLAALQPYIREVRPVLVGVDGGADALLDAGLRPDLIIGDMDSVTNRALISGALLVVHAYPDGTAPGLERVRALGLPAIVFEAPGTSEDIAMLLAYERGAELIVAVGTHANLIEFLDKGRRGMASTFLTRLRVGSILVDAKGVSRLYRGRIRRFDMMLLVAATLVTMAIVVALSPALRTEVEAIRLQLVNLWFSIRDALAS